MTDRDSSCHNRYNPHNLYHWDNPQCGPLLAELRKCSVRLVLRMDVQRHGHSNRCRQGQILFRILNKVFSQAVRKVNAIGTVCVTRAVSEFGKIGAIRTIGLTRSKGGVD